MAANEGLKPLDKSQDVPVDPNVHIPDHVRAAADAAAALHRQAYEPPQQQQEQQPPAQQQEQHPPAQQQEQQPPAQQQEQHPPLRPEDQNVSAEEWRHRFLSMQGRYNAAVRDKASTEEQMTQLAQELVRTQNMLEQGQRQQPGPQSSQIGQDHGNLITDEDRANYGDELIDLARRAAQSAVNPELERLRADNERLTQRVQSTGRRELFAEFDRQVPTWRAINNDNRFKAWLRLPNVYTGQLRGTMLKAAVDGADAPKAVALFKDFLAEAQATGQMAPAGQIEQQQAQQAAPRTPALDLETLAAPGRARPASGDSQVPSEKPIYSRADISRFYDEKRRGLWANRLADAQAFENDLTAAQREGRIRG